MNENEILVHAKSYIDQLANGINPLDGSQIADNEVVNNVRISRCLFYVSGILQQVIDAGGTVKAVKPKKKKFQITDEEILNLKADELPLSISELAKKINLYKNDENMSKLSHRRITDWLVELGFLEKCETSDGKSRQKISDEGKKIGIFLEDRMGAYGPYTVKLYSKEAQQFIIDNLQSILASSDDFNSENHGMPWNEEQDKILLDLYQKQMPISSIADEMKRSQGAIKARLKKLGIAEV